METKIAKMNVKIAEIPKEWNCRRKAISCFCHLLIVMESAIKLEGICSAARISQRGRNFNWKSNET